MTRPTRPTVSDVLGGTQRGMLLCCVAGLAVVGWLRPFLTDGTETVGSVFYILFVRHEIYYLLLIPLLLFSICRLANHGKIPDVVVASFTDASRVRRSVGWIALILFALCWGGGNWIYHAFPLCMDEYGAHFQSRIFSTWRVFAPVDSEWEPYAEAMTPNFVNYHTDGKGWISHYLPVYAMLRAPFVAAGIPWILNPLLVAASVIGMAKVARHIWPDRPESELLAALLLAFSVQFIATGMSGYTYPAHLCFNIGWLYLYLRNTPWSLSVAPLLGVAALGLHQPVVHAAFVAPFLLRLVLQRRWWWSAYMISIYAVGLLGWAAWLRAARPELGREILGRVFGLPDLLHIIHQAMNVCLLITWQPMVMVLALFALHRLKGQPKVIKDLALSCLITFGFYVFYVRNQGHGWGYRYCHAVLGNISLLAVAGWFQLRQVAGQRPAIQFLAWGAVTTWILLVPLRLIQMERFIGPFARAHEYLRGVPAPVVLFDPTGVWQGLDLVRNDPLFEQPNKVFSTQELTDEQIVELREHHEVKRVERKQLIALGVQPTRPRDGGDHED